MRSCIPLTSTCADTARLNPPRPDLQAQWKAEAKGSRAECGPASSSCAPARSSGSRQALSETRDTALCRSRATERQEHTKRLSSPAESEQLFATSKVPASRCSLVRYYCAPLPDANGPIFSADVPVVVIRFGIRGEQLPVNRRRYIEVAIGPAAVKLDFEGM